MARTNFKQTGGVLRGLLLMIIGLVVMLMWLFQPPEGVVTAAFGPVNEQSDIDQHLGDEVRPECWSALGERDMFGSDAQAEELKRRWSKSDCAWWGISWKYRSGQVELISMLVADEARGDLYRIKYRTNPGGDSDESYVAWHDVTTSAVSTLEPGAGIDVGRFVAGEMPPEEVRVFIADNAEI